jgi:hypothetical protein
LQESIANPKVHHNQAGGETMSEWKRLELAEDENEDTTSTDLSSVPQMLHQEFLQEADHLHEVQAMHTHVLVQAGMLPESHLAEVEPSQRLDWVLQELHGMRDPDGLTIPLKGVSSDDVEISIMDNDSETSVKVTVREQGHEPFERVLPLRGENLDVKAHFVDGHLRLRW